MLQNKIYTVATLGLQHNEVRFIKITLGFTCHASTTRAQGRYLHSDDVEKADIVIVDAQDTVSLNVWHELSVMHPTKKLLLVYSIDQVPLTKYYFSRPFGPSKILMLLDKIVKDDREYVPEIHAFTNKAKAAHREVFNNSQYGPASRHTALVIDDSPTVRKMLILELGCFNIHVDPAESGELGLGMIREKQYDIIFLDVILPGLNGYDVCKMIRKDLKNRKTPIVMLTSKSSPIDKVRGSLAGCSNYMTKPVDHENFYQVLEGYLAHANRKVNSAKNYA